jgi:hypothetical protein
MGRDWLPAWQDPPGCTAALGTAVARHLLI